MNYRVEYRDQNWMAADIEAASPAEAAKLYLRRDSEMRWRDYDEIVVCWGKFARESESFPIHDLLPLIRAEPPELAIPGPLARLKHRLFGENIPEIPGQPPKVIRWFKVYSGVQCLLNLASAPFLLSFFFAVPVDTGMAATVTRGMQLFLFVLSLGFFGACLLPLILRPRPWLWTHGLVVIWIGLMNACTLPAGLLLLRAWHKPKTKKYFGKS